MGNYNLSEGALGFAYRVIDGKFESGVLDSADGHKLEIGTKTTNYAVNYLGLTPKFNYYAGYNRESHYYERKNILDSNWVWRSTGTNVHSASTTLETNQFNLGVLYKVNPEIAFGALFSPAYGSKEKIENTSGRKTLEIEQGDGNRIRVGVGYNQESLSAGLDFIYLDENKPYEVRAKNVFLADAHFLVQPNFSLTGRLSQTQARELITEEDIRFSPYSETRIELGFMVGIGTVAFEIAFLNENTSYDAKDPLDFEKSSSSGFSLGAKAQF